MYAGCTEAALFSINNAFECINSVTIDENYKKDVIKTMRAYIEPYVFSDILKSPPTVSGHADYYPTVNLENELTTIENDNSITTFYDLYQKLSGVIMKCNDGHFNFGISSTTNKDIYIDRMYFFSPGKIQISNEKDVRIVPVEMWSSLVPQELIDNKDKKIKTINGKDPITYIQEFADKHTAVRSPHGRFFNAISAISGTFLSVTPLSQDELNQGLKLVYEDNTQLTLNYYVYYEGPKTSNKLQGIYKELFENKIDKYSHPLQNTILYKLERMKRKSRKRDDPYSSSDGSISCKYSTEKKVNVLQVTTFNPQNLDEFPSIYNKCVDLFDTNDDPIIVIVPGNGGGAVAISQDLVRTLSPTMATFETGSFKISKVSEYLARTSYCSMNQDPETCQERCKVPESGYYEGDLGDWYNKPRTINYKDSNGNVVSEHKIAQPSKFEMTGYELKRLEKKRKPTDIVIFTDGYCFSACSMFVKNMKQNGGAIIVGYGGNPDTTYDDVFDIGESPTNVLEDKDLDEYEGYNEITKLRKQLGIKMRFSYEETYKRNFNFDETYPREYTIELPDRRIKTLHYESMDNVDEFINEGLKVIEEFKTKCNSNNKQLVKMDDSCKGKIENGDGGFKCGDNNQWTTECVTVSCSNFDTIYDETKNKCIENKCYKCGLNGCEECSYLQDLACLDCKEGYDLTEELQCKEHENDNGSDNGSVIIKIMLMVAIISIII